jgi:ParB-like chromosome segregation protein Spo0J
MSDALDKRSEEGLDQAVEKAFEAADKDVYEYKGKKYTAHAAATLFPLITGEDFEALVASLRQNGMRHPVLLLGDKIVDGRNRFRAALEAGVEIIFEQVDPNEDVCRRAMDENIHRRDLRSNKRVLVASQLRRMSLRLERLRHEEMARAARVKAASEASAEGKSPEAGVEGSARAAPVDAGSGEGPAPAGGVEAVAKEAAEGKEVSGLDQSSSRTMSRAKAAEAAGVSASSLKRFDRVVEKAPELEEEIAEGRISVRDAVVVSEEDPELRRQVVDDVKAGRARTGAAAIEKRTGRAPKARSSKPSGGAKPQEGAGGVAGMPPLPSLGGGADGKAGDKDAVPAGAAAPAVVSAAGSGPSHPALPADALSPSLLMAGVRKAMELIEFDPCSSEKAQERVRALQWLSAEEDGCQKAWTGASYVFPPARFAGRFASKLMGEMMAGRVPRGVFLAPSTMDDESEGLLLRNQRLTGVVQQLERGMFDVEGGNPVKAPCRMVLYVFGIEPKRLYDAFDPWGKVLTVARR